MLFILFDGRWERYKRGQKVVGDGKSDLGFWLEWFGEVNDVVLCRPESNKRMGRGGTDWSVLRC